MSSISLFHWQPILHARHWKVSAFGYLDFVVFLFKNHCYNLKDRGGKREMPSCDRDHVEGILLGEEDGKSGRFSLWRQVWQKRGKSGGERGGRVTFMRGHTCRVVADDVVRTQSKSEYRLGTGKLILPGDKPIECLNANMHELLFLLLFGNFICDSFWCFQGLKWQKTSSESTVCPWSLARSLSSRGSELLALIVSRNGLVCTSLLSSSPDLFLFACFRESSSRQAEDPGRILHLPDITLPCSTAVDATRASQIPICFCDLGRYQAVFGLLLCTISFNLLCLNSPAFLL